MFKPKGILFIYTETPTHAGSGISLGPVDLTIQRQRYTDHPIIQASEVRQSIKWELKKRGTAGVEEVFGADPEPGKPPPGQGAIAFEEARLILFPVRSIQDVFCWITCPLVLAQFKRDLNNVPNLSIGWDVPTEDLREGEAFVAPGSPLIIQHDNRKSIVLEDFEFKAKEAEQVINIAQWLADNTVFNSSGYDYWKRKLREKKELVILRDEDFKDFTKIAVEIITRVRLNENKTVEEGPWDEEYLPSDTLLYSSMRLSSSAPSTTSGIVGAIKNLGRLQIGGNETIGKGIVKVNLLEGGKQNVAKKT